MKNNYFIYIFIFIFFIIKSSLSFSDELKINSSKINVDKKTKIVSLEGNVSAIDSRNNKIEVIST